MKAFSPYHIIHLQLHQKLNVPVLNTGGQGHYIVFWWEEVALGHFFVEPNTQMTAPEYYKNLIVAIRPAVNFYAQNSSISNAAWEKWIIRQKFELFRQWMGKVFGSWKSDMYPEKVSISVIICTRNRALQLNRCLIMLRELRCIPEEVIVIDNAPDDDSSQEVVRHYKEVRYIKEPRIGLDIARNTGILAAKCPVVTFIDDDVTVHPLCIYRIWQTFQNPSIDAMTGLVIASELQTEAQFIFEKFWSFNRGYTDIIYDSDFFESTLSTGPPVWRIGAGANMAFRRSIFKEVGLFDERLDVGAAGCSGDSEMWYRILAKDLTIQYNPRATVFHEHRKEIKGLKKQLFNYMRGHAAAALIQQNQRQEAGYKQHLVKILMHYSRSLIRGFPNYRFQYQTLGAQTLGIISGMIFYLKNKNQRAYITLVKASIPVQCKSTQSTN